MNFNRQDVLSKGSGLWPPECFMPFLVIAGISPRPIWFSHSMLLSKTTYSSPQWETILFNGLNCHFCIHVEVIKPSFLFFTLMTQQSRLITFRQSSSRAGWAPGLSWILVTWISTCLLFSGSDLLYTVSILASLAGVWQHKHLYCMVSCCSRPKLPPSKDWLTPGGCRVDTNAKALTQARSLCNTYRPYSDKPSPWPYWLLSKMDTIRPRK